MKINNPYSQLKDLIILEKNAIPKNLCEYVIGMIENEKWQIHQWNNSIENVSFSNEDKELEVCLSPEFIQNLLTPYIIEAKNNYISKTSYNENSSNLANNFSQIRFNRYDVGQVMRNHYDHIKTLFTPPERGIPILSMIIGLNGDYRGGELVFWDNTEFKLSTGDIIIWPSLFLYPHKVNEIIKNKRYTGVVWFW
jgi:hypothetical protein